MLLLGSLIFSRQAIAMRNRGDEMTSRARIKRMADAEQATRNRIPALNIDIVDEYSDSSSSGRLQPVPSDGSDYTLQSREVSSEEQDLWTPKHCDTKWKIGTDNAIGKKGSFLDGEYLPVAPSILRSIEYGEKLRRIFMGRQGACVWVWEHSDGHLIVQSETWPESQLYIVYYDVSEPVHDDRYKWLFTSVSTTDLDQEDLEIGLSSPELSLNESGTGMGFEWDVHCWCEHIHYYPERDYITRSETKLLENPPQDLGVHGKVCKNWYGGESTENRHFRIESDHLVLRESAGSVPEQRFPLAHITMLMASRKGKHRFYLSIGGDDDDQQLDIRWNNEADREKLWKPLRKATGIKQPELFL